MPSSTVNGLPYPSGSTANAVPTHMSDLIAVLDTGSVVKRLTSAQIAALTSGQKPAGLVVYNSTTGRLQVSDGSAWDPVVTDPEWTAYTPAWTASGTAPALGNGSLTGYYLRLGDHVAVEWRLILGSTSTQGTGQWRISLPFAPASTPAVCMIGYMVPDGSNLRPMLAAGANGSEVGLWTMDGSALVGVGVPVAWVAGGSAAVSGVYRVA